MSWKLRGRLAGLILLSISFVAANAGYSTGPAQAGSGYPATVYGAFETRMIAAESAARRHLDQFFNFILDDSSMVRTDAGVKVAVSNGDGTPNLVWLSVVAKHDDRFVGLLTDASSANNNYRVGDMIDFNQAQVRDWYFFGSSGKIFGAYTTRAALSDLPAASAAQIGRQLSDTPLPSNW